MTEAFFKEIEGVLSFSEACDSSHYQPVPEGWYVVVTDVEGSTKAIQDGRYKEVNMIGAACITVVVNACKGISIPYVFGGDGATFLVPESCIDTVKRELMGVKNLAKTLYGLPLRVGVVPITEITERGKVFTVGKYLMPTGYPLAMFGGGGAVLADGLVKSGGFDIEDEKFVEPDLSDLSCRWQPLKTRKGVILTLLVMFSGQGDSHAAYKELNNYIEKILGEDSNPVKAESLSYKPPALSTLTDEKIVWKNGNSLKKIFDHIFEITLFNVVVRLNLKLGKLNAEKYTNDMISNSDYRKFDDMLRMVVDCTEGQARLIEEHLQKLYDQGLIIYGSHSSDSALMTCFVSSLESMGHIHFIDGSDGGYALAAKKLKERAQSQKAA